MQCWLFIYDTHPSSSAGTHTLSTIPALAGSDICIPLLPRHSIIITVSFQTFCTRKEMKYKFMKLSEHSLSQGMVSVRICSLQKWAFSCKTHNHIFSHVACFFISCKCSFQYTKLRQKDSLWKARQMPIPRPGWQELKIKRSFVKL